MAKFVQQKMSHKNHAWKIELHGLVWQPWFVAHAFFPFRFSQIKTNIFCTLRSEISLFRFPKKPSQGLLVKQKVIRAQ